MMISRSEKTKSNWSLQMKGRDTRIIAVVQSLFGFFSFYFHTFTAFCFSFLLCSLKPYLVRVLKMLSDSMHVV